MAYNRCIGTRYCSNNCSRFVVSILQRVSSLQPGRGFEDQNDKIVDVENEDQLLFIIRNQTYLSDSVGDGECNYCYQRVNRGKVDAKLAANERDAEQ